jgi:hypothetical protein
LHILAGTTSETATFDASMTVQAENGTVRIGAP